MWFKMSLKTNLKSNSVSRAVWSRFCSGILLFLGLSWLTLGGPVNAESFQGENGTFMAVTFAPSQVPGALIYEANWRIWIPDGVETLRGIVIHQHGCGDGSSKPGNSAVEDWQWQALARKYDCALVAVSYVQTGACEMWCDPRNGSAESLFKALEHFARESGHPEMTVVPWAIWGHSGGGQWTASMVHLYPERVLCAWCRSGHPNTVGNTLDSLPFSEKMNEVPMILNLGVREKTEFKKIWDEGFPYVQRMRRAGVKIAIFLDPDTGHCCGDSRYPAIRFLDLCMEQRLPERAGSAEIRPMKTGIVLSGDEIWSEFAKNKKIGENRPNSGELVGDALKPFLAEGFWLPTADFVDYWRKYQEDASVQDVTPPPAPLNVNVQWQNAEGKTDVWIGEVRATLTWSAFSDLESGLAEFIVERDGVEIARVSGSKEAVARHRFQGLKYSDTPSVPTPKRTFTDTISLPERTSAESLPVYSVRSVNTNGLVSEPTSVK